MKIGISALGDLANDTGGRTYLTGLVQGLQQATSHDEITIFLHAASLKVLDPTRFGFQTRIASWGERKGGRVLFEQTVMSHWTKEIDVLYSPSNALPIGACCPVVLGVQNVLPFFANSDEGWLRRRYRRWILPRSMHKASSVLVPSQYARDIVAKAFGMREKISVIPHGIDHTFFYPEPNLVKSQSRYILWVSAFWQYKNWELALEAFSKLYHHSRNRLEFHMAGDMSNAGVRTRFQYLLKKLRLSAESVKVLGHMLPEELVAEYRNAEFLVYPSRVESFGFPLLEAMACGIPVIASGCPALRELCGEAALYVEDLTIDHLMRAMGQILNNQIDRRMLISKGLERAAGFSWQKTARLTLDAIYSSARQRVSV